jgi:3-methyladenine DNA glycosylase/8-oxoguanine DNA glycosylase
MPRHPTLFDRSTADEAARELAARDPALGSIIERCGPLRLPARTRGGAFAFLARTVVYQQLAIAAAARIHGRLVSELAPRDGRLTPDRLLSASEGAFRRAGVSGPKRRALIALAEAVWRGDLSPRGLSQRDDAQIREAITALQGFGRWSAEMFLIFHLGRTDVFPATDLGIRYGIAALDGGAPEGPADPRDAAARAELWRPWRSAAAWWLWRSRSGRPPGIA